LTNFCKYAKHDSIFEGEKVSEDTEYPRKLQSEKKDSSLIHITAAKKS